MTYLHDQNEFWEEEGKARKREIKEFEDQIRGHETTLFRARQQTSSTTTLAVRQQTHRKGGKWELKLKVDDEACLYWKHHEQMDTTD